MFVTDFTECDAAQTLAAASLAYEAQRQGELDLILAAQHHADLHPKPGRSQGLPGGEQARVYGGDGNPEIAEFAVAEFGVVIGRSSGSAARFVGQCVALRHRFPRIWERVKSGHATGWRALQVVQECVDLSEEAAAIVDRRVANLVDTVTLAQLQKIIKAASWRADPEAADAKAKASAKERGVWVGRTDEHGSTKLYIKAATGDVISLYATLNQLADALAALGDTSSIHHRRAKAAGLLSDPALAADLLAAVHHLAGAQPANTPNSSPTQAPPCDAPASTTTPTQAPRPDATATATTPTEPARAESTSAASAGAEESAPETPAGTATSAESAHAAFGSSSAPAASASTEEPALEPPASAATPTEPTHTASTLASESSEAPVPSEPHVTPIPDQDIHHDRGSQSTSDTCGDQSDDRPAGSDADRRPVDDLLDLLLDDLTEPGPDDEADRDTPHPNTPDHPLDHDQPTLAPIDPGAALPNPPGQPLGERPSPPGGNPGTGQPPGTAGQPPEPVDDPACAGMDAAARLELRRKIDATRRDHPERCRQTNQTVLNLHITDETLLAGKGTARVEGYGPVYTDRLEELLGHHRVVLRPVIDLNTALSVHAYEIPHRIRDHVNLRYPVEQFPYGTTETRTTATPRTTANASTTRETRSSTDLDHIEPYRPGASSEQTSTDNLAPQARFGHRLKTHGNWKLRRIDEYTLEWTTEHGYKFHLDHNGTHRL